MSAKLGWLCVVCVQTPKLSVIRSSRVLAIQGLLNELKDSWDFQNCSSYHGCSLFEGCPY